ncbi:FAD-dependent monooxygenase [Frateuria aurantia]
MTKHPSQRPARSVLISGASIAGPTLAYWLDRYGVDVTVVERAAAIRSGGYPIDVRGTAMRVIERMGLRPAVEAAHIASNSMTFVDHAGLPIGTVPVYELTGNADGHDVELPRGELTRLIYGLTRNSRVRYRFEDAIDALEDDGAGVDVRFRSGVRQRFDVVVAADGLHSSTRGLVFGPEAPFNHYLGQSFNIFSMPNDLGLSHQVMVYAEAGRVAGLYAVQNHPRLFAFLAFATETPPFGAGADPGEQIARTAEIFAADGWEVPRMLSALRQADDLFFDTVSQIRMPHWSRSRVALVGDAAYAPSFRSGQGTSLALVGAYVLAGELASHDNPVEAFGAYERLMRPFVEANQALAIKRDVDYFMPRTQDQLAARNRMLVDFDRGASTRDRRLTAHRAHNSLTLPDYGADVD